MSASDFVLLNSLAIELSYDKPAEKFPIRLGNAGIATMVLDASMGVFGSL